MKMKKFFSGILAAVMSIAVIAMPLSTATAAETDPNADKCIITINHAASTGTYTAYPIFVGDVELEEGTGRKLISSPTFHKNLDTTLSGSSPIDIVARVYSGTPPTSTNGYSLWQYLKNSSWKVKQGKDDTTGKTFLELIKAYDPNTSFSSFSITADDAASSQAEALANILNLTSSDNAAVIGSNGILGGARTSAFYSAFAEAARMLMVDKITSGDVGTLTGTKEGTLADGKVTIEVAEPGYYLVEYTPAGDSTDYEKAPRAVRRSLVLVGKGTALSATINSKDTQNIASVDVTFNETMLVQGDDNTFSYGDKTEGTWAKNVSAGNGDYVNCRVVVTLPGNLAAYDQYYLAVPIMYGYSVPSNLSNDFEHDKSIIRQTEETDKTKNVKVYFLDGENRTYINNDKFTIPTSYTYADDKTNPTGGVTADKFVATETFVFNDVKKLSGSIGSTTKLVIEFPVKFERFDTTWKASASVGVANLGFNGSTSSGPENWTGDDALLKNYITARAVYSNNPNLKALTADEKNENGTPKDTNKHLYLDTSKDPGALQNPVGVAKESSANIVTYRLRVHATTEELKEISQAGGVEGIRFVLYDNTNKKYAEAALIGSNIDTYDTVTNEILKDGKGPFSTGNAGKTRVYKITGWVDSYITTTVEGEDKTETTNEDCVLTTFNAKGSSTVWANNNTGRFEIVGLAPGDYTIIALDETIKTYEVYKGNTTDNDWKEYSISKEGGKPKTEYRFSFAPTLSTTCTKLLYNTHYAPNNFDLGSLQTNEISTYRFNTNGTYDPKKPDIHSINTTGLITNYNMKWYAKNDKGEFVDATNPDWWLGQREDVALMSMRVTYIKKGLTLPVTGGIGTFIFFAVGGAMVVLSTVAIVTKLRIKREQL